VGGRRKGRVSSNRQKYEERPIDNGVDTGLIRLRTSGPDRSSVSGGTVGVGVLPGTGEVGYEKMGLGIKWASSGGDYGNEVTKDP